MNSSLEFFYFIYNKHLNIFNHMFIKHLTNKEYQIHTKSSSDNKDPNVFSDYYLIHISNDEERIVNKKDLEKILKKKRSQRN